MSLYSEPSHVLRNQYVAQGVSETHSTIAEACSMHRNNQKCHGSYNPSPSGYGYGLNWLDFYLQRHGKSTVFNMEVDNAARSTIHHEARSAVCESTRTTLSNFVICY
jgi:hypothetical protein